jgi:hypothetical protein
MIYNNCLEKQVQPLQRKGINAQIVGGSETNITNFPYQARIRLFKVCRAK